MNCCYWFDWLQICILNTWVQHSVPWDHLFALYIYCPLHPLCLGNVARSWSVVLSANLSYFQTHFSYKQIYRWIPNAKMPTLAIFRWFKFTFKPPYSIAIGKLHLAIWDTSFWISLVKFGHKGPWDIF